MLFLSVCVLYQIKNAKSFEAITHYKLSNPDVKDILDHLYKLDTDSGSFAGNGPNVEYEKIRPFVEKKREKSAPRVSKYMMSILSYNQCNIQNYIFSLSR